MQKVLSVTDNLIGTHALALHTDNRGSLIVIQSGNLHGKRKAGGWFGIFFFKGIHQKDACLPSPYLFLADFLETQCASSKMTGGVAGRDCLPGNAGFL